MSSDTLVEYDFQINYDVEFTQAHFVSVISSSFAAKELDLIKSGLELAVHYHSGQTRSDGNVYVTHPIRVALLILKYEQLTTSEIIIAALLHDALEDTKLTEREIQEIFGELVLSYVVGTTRYRQGQQTAEIRRLGKIEKWERTMRSSQEIRVVKTFDHLDNVISMKFISPERPDFTKIPRWLMQTQTMFLPLAEITNPDAYKLMKRELDYYIAKGFRIGDWYSG